MEIYKEIHIELLQSEIRRIFSDVLEVGHTVEQLCTDLKRLEASLNSQQCIFYKTKKQESEKGK